MIRRIYAIVGEADFYKFLTRAKEEKFSMGEALAALVKAYIDGDISLEKHRAALSKAYAEGKAMDTLADIEVMHE